MEFIVSYNEGMVTNTIVWTCIWSPLTALLIRSQWLKSAGKMCTWAIVFLAAADVAAMYWVLKGSMTAHSWLLYTWVKWPGGFWVKLGGIEKLRIIRYKTHFTHCCVIVIDASCSPWVQLMCHAVVNLDILESLLQWIPQNPINTNGGKIPWLMEIQSQHKLSHTGQFQTSSMMGRQSQKKYWSPWIIQLKQLQARPYWQNIWQTCHPCLTWTWMTLHKKQSQPRYGNWWGQIWTDTSTFADTKGLPAAICWTDW